MLHGRVKIHVRNFSCLSRRIRYISHPNIFGNRLPCEDTFSVNRVTELRMHGRATHIHVRKMISKGNLPWIVETRGHFFSLYKSVGVAQSYPHLSYEGSWVRSATQIRLLAARHGDPVVKNSD